MNNNLEERFVELRNENSKYSIKILELKQELKKTREQLEKALIHLKIVLVDDTTSDQFCDAEEFLSSFKDKQGE